MKNMHFVPLHKTNVFFTVKTVKINENKAHKEPYPIFSVPKDVDTAYKTYAYFKNMHEIPCEKRKTLRKLFVND